MLQSAAIHIVANIVSSSFFDGNLSDVIAESNCSVHQHFHSAHVLDQFVVTQWPEIEELS